MPRRVQDIVPGDRRSIRDVELRKKPDADDKPLRKRSAPETKPAKQERADDDAETVRIHKSDTSSMRRMNMTPSHPPHHHGKPPRNNKKWILAGFGAVVVIALFAFLASTKYSRASFVITPKVIPLSINGTYVAQGTPAKGMLAYELVTIKSVASTTVPAVDGKTTSTKSRGKVTVYNTFSDQPVRLIAGSRLSNDSGLVYRLTSSIVIPGYTKPQGSIVPGKILAEIIADQPGAQYNIGKADAISDFKFLGYKGTPKYDSVYARLSGDVSGGQVGANKVISPTLMASTTAKLKAGLSSSLQARIKDSVPEDYIFIDNGYSVSFPQPSVVSVSKDTASVVQDGVIYGIILKKKDLINKLSSGQSDLSFGEFGYKAPGLETMQFSFTNIKDFSPTKKIPMVFKAKGDFKLVAEVPVDEISKKLQGNSLSNTQEIFKSYSPIIESGTGELVPPWAKIPTDPKRISITVQE